MLGLILNETEIVNKTLNGELELPSKPSKVLRIVIKKLIIENKNKEEIKKIIVDLLKKTYGENYNETYWNKYINNTIKFLEKKKYKMIDIDKVEIYEEELNEIQSLNNIRLEKLAFILLVYAKINNIINPLNNGKINIPLTYIIKESLLKKDDNSKMLLSKLYDKKYISQGNSCDATKIEVKYIKNKGNVKIVIDDLRDYQPITWYLEYKNIGKWKLCKCCGKRFEINPKSKKPTLMCKNCAKENHYIRTKDLIYKKRKC